MSIRIRVYPRNGLGAMGAMGAMGGIGAYGGAVSAQTFYNQKLSAQQQISNLQLQYERALWSEKINSAVLQERMKNPYAAAYGAYGGAYGGYGQVASPMMGVAGIGGIGGSFFGGLGLGGMF